MILKNKNLKRLRIVHIFFLNILLVIFKNLINNFAFCTLQQNKILKAIYE